MDKQSLKLQYKVGIFILLGLVAGLTAILLLGGNRVFFTRYIHIKAKFTEVSGLFPGSVVSLAGLPVGNVDSINFAPAENKLVVDLKINTEFQSRLVEGTIAEVRTQGALGDKFVYLIPGPTGGAAIRNGTEIAANETDFMKLLTDRQDGVARIVDLIKELHVFVASINQGGHSGQMMHNMADASAKFKSTLTQLDGLLGDVRSNIPQDKKLQQAIISLANILEKVDKGQGTLGQLINDPSVHQSLKSFLGGSPRNRYMKDMIRETIQQSER
jgi:phospholipid/cholesterol/gamma-HCH transport system substrate-binding protein